MGPVARPMLRVPFGWAKPVPVNPLRFHNGVSLRLGMLMTAAAGPLSNLVLAGLAAVLLTLLPTHAPAMPRWKDALYVLLEQGVLINMALAAFNMLPIHPLDGSRVVDGLLSPAWRDWWRRIGRWGAIVLLLLLVTPEGFGVGLVSRLCGWASAWLGGGS